MTYVHIHVLQILRIITQVLYYSKCGIGILWSDRIHMHIDTDENRIGQNHLSWQPKKFHLVWHIGRTCRMFLWTKPKWPKCDEIVWDSSKNSGIVNSR